MAGLQQVRRADVCKEIVRRTSAKDAPGINEREIKTEKNSNLKQKSRLTLVCLLLSSVSSEPLSD